VNRYSVFKDDIEGCGFELITMDGEVTEEVVEKVRRVLEDPDSFETSAERNFEIAGKHFGYRTLEVELHGMVRAVMRG
jgi:hypothetical protein